MCAVTGVCRLAHARAHYGVLDWLQAFLPMVGWLRTYKVKKYLLVRCLPPLPTAGATPAQHVGFIQQSTQQAVAGS